MKKNLILLLAIITLINISCKEEKKVATEPTQMQNVMAVHDEVMPKMSEIGKLITSLKPMADSTETGLQYRETINELKNANKSMMDWMQGFGDKFDSDEVLSGKALSPEKQNLLDIEEEKIKEVANLMNSSIAKAEALLKK